jgi:hypothetical protein
MVGRWRVIRQRQNQAGQAKMWRWQQASAASEINSICAASVHRVVRVGVSPSGWDHRVTLLTAPAAISPSCDITTERVVLSGRLCFEASRAYGASSYGVAAKLKQLQLWHRETI